MCCVQSAYMPRSENDTDSEEVCILLQKKKHIYMSCSVFIGKCDYYCCTHAQSEEIPHFFHNSKGTHIRFSVTDRIAPLKYGVCVCVL